MQVPRFSLKISLIEMAPRSALATAVLVALPCPALPCLSPQTDTIMFAPQGTGSDWKNLPSIAQFLSTHRQAPYLL